MIKKINEIIEKIRSFEPSSKEEADLFRIKYLGKSGELNKLFDDFKTVPNSEKKSCWQGLK